MTHELSPDERETNISMTGDNHDSWTVYSDDPYWQRRIEKLGVPFEVCGAGRRYRLTADQVLLRKGKRQVSEAQRRAFAQNAHFGGKTPVVTGELQQEG